MAHCSHRKIFSVLMCLISAIIVVQMYSNMGVAVKINKDDILQNKDNHIFTTDTGRLGRLPNNPPNVRPRAAELLRNLPHPYLTLFTSIKDISNRKDAHLYVLKNWARFYPWVQPVLFVENITQELLNQSSWTNRALEHGWTVLNYGPSGDGSPVLKYMAQDVLSLKLGSVFHGFSNAEILFNYDLLFTLEAFAKYLGGVNDNVIFVSGIRKNVDLSMLSLYKEPHDPDMITRIAQIKKQPEFYPSSADYFIYAQGYPWDKTPDFVVGRIRMDSWYISEAVRWNISYLEGTYTILAVHLTGADGNLASGNINKNKWYNRDLAKGYPFGKGNQHHAPYFSEFKAGCSSNNSSDCITITKRG